MTAFKQDDGHGHSMILLDTDGYRTCTFGDPEATSRRIREMPTFKCRADDVFVCVPPKSGTHWTWEMVCMMYQGKAQTIPSSKIANMIEAMPWYTLESLPSPRVLNTHLHYNMLPNAAKEMGCKIIHVLRNPKDLAVSFYKHVSGMPLYEYNGEWEHFLPLFLHGKTEYGSWFEYVLEWEKEMANNPNLPILRLYFEDFKENTLQEVNKIGQFLGIENKDGLFETISEKCQFHNMVKDKQQYLAPNTAILGEGFSFYRKVSMTTFKQDDGHGHSMTLCDTDGYKTCTFGDSDATERRIREMPTFKCRADDVFLCAPAKSGTHWTWEIICMIYQGKAETIPKSKVTNMMEAMPWDTLASLSSPRVLNTHVHYSMLPKEAKGMGCKIIYVLRNPKDLAVSLYKHVRGITMYEYDGEWEHFLPLFLHGKTEYNSWFEYVLEWEKEISNNPDLPILLIYFEDLKQNTLQEVNRIGQFLGVENKDGLFEAISEKCQFHNMVKDKEQFLAPNTASLGDGFTFFRKGVIGDWKNWFTVAQNELFDQVYDEKMSNSKHKFKYS